MATMATMPTEALEEPSARPPLDFVSPTADGVDVAPLEVAEDDALGELPVLELELLLARSTGIIIGLLPTLPRSTDPSELRTSGLAARKERVNRMFWAMRGCAHSGILPMSKLEPQSAARLLFAVCVAVSEAIAAVVESFIKDGIIAAAEVGAPLAFGGLITPNMPFSQCVGVPQ